MNTALIARTCNDADIIEAFVRHHAGLADLLVIIDEGCLDGTRAILEALRGEGLPLLIVDDPAVGASPAGRLTQVYRMVAPIFAPDLVWLLEVGQFVRGDRVAIESELACLPSGATAILRCATYVPDAATAARATLVDPLAMIVNRRPADEPGECHAVYKRDPADDATLAIDAIGQPLRRGDDAMPAFLCEHASLACLPLRGTAQLTARLVHEWRAHRARQVGDSGARARFAARALLDQVLAGLALTPGCVVQAALGATSADALVREPVAHDYATLRYLHLVDHAALAPVIDGARWPMAAAPSTSVATGEAIDLAPLLDLCAGLRAERAIVMGSPAWTGAIAAALPELDLHVPTADEQHIAADLVFVPGMPATFADELAEVVPPDHIRRIALWPAQPRAAGVLSCELERWHAAGWEPDMMGTLSFRALSTYATARHGALVLQRIDAERAARSQAVRRALVEIDARVPEWIDPPASLILHPLQSIGLRTPPAPVDDAAPVAPATVAPRSVLILGAGRSGTSCLAGMFGPPTHHHASALYAPGVSNPKGYFEAGHINDLNESILLTSAVAHLGAEATRTLLQGFEPHQLWLARFPDAMPAAWSDAHRREIAKAVAVAPFVLKDPRMSVTAPAWLEAAPDALILAIHRAPGITAESILKECRVATYLLDFRISMRDAFDVWRQAYRRAARLYRAGADVLFLRYDDLFDADRLARLEELVRAPLQRAFAEKHLDRTAPSPRVPDECAALGRLLDELSVLTFERRRGAAEAAIDRHFAQWPDRPPAPASVAAAATA